MRGRSLLGLGLSCLVTQACSSPGAIVSSNASSEGETTTGVGDASESGDMGDGDGATGGDGDDATGGDGDGDGDTGGDGDGDGDTGGDGDGDGDGDTGGDGDGDTGGDGDGDTGGDGDAVCAPGDQPLVAQFWFEPVPTAGLSETCTVSASSSSGNESSMVLNCAGTERTLVVQSTIGAPSPSQGSQLIIDYRSALSGLGQNRWLTIARPTSGGQSTIFGMIDASALAPPNTTALQFFSPLDLQPTSQLCPTYEDDCSLVSPRVVELGTTGGPITEVAQGQIRYFNVLPWGAEVAMVQAWQREAPVLCDDVPETWYQAAIRYEYGP